MQNNSINIEKTANNSRWDALNKGIQAEMLWSINWNEAWPLRLAFMLLGYCIIAIPTAAIVVYVRRKCAAGEIEPNTLFRSFLINFAVGRPEYELMSSESKNSSSAAPKKRLWDDCVRLVLFFAGIQATLVSMGFLQERIITQGYVLILDRSKIEKFGDTQFLVFCNRIFALILSGSFLFLRWKREPVHVPPLYKHSYTSFSNTLSSWCQYEALKYVSFPTQTVCKASKILPTMLMGYIVRGEHYDKANCLSALFLAVGAFLFFFSSGTPASTHIDNTTTVSGLILMFGYLMFDGFTLNWQKTLFDTRPKVSKYQMMFGVNAFSIALCFISLIEQRSLLPSFNFLTTHEDFARDIFLLSLSGALGQIVIYMTIERFGPIVFAIIMTLRQTFSIVLSAIAYGHPMSVVAIFGLFIVFGAIFINLYRQYFKNSTRT